MTDASNRADRSASPVNVLLVDDREENLAALEAVLAPLALRLVRACSAEEALRHALREDFAVVLLDVRMPGTSGFETARLLKQRERSRLTPIIFVTAYGEDRRRITDAYQSGAVDYLFKPLDPDVLRAKVSTFADLWRRSHDVQQEQRRRYADETRRASVEAERDRLFAVLDSLPDATSVFDREWRWTYTNPAAASLLRDLGLDPAECIGEVVWDRVPQFAGARGHHEARRAVAERRIVEFEDYFESLDRWLETRVVPIAEGALVYSRDVSVRRRAEQALRILDEVNTAVAGTLDSDSMLRRLVAAVVPTIAEWCVVDLLDHDARAARRVAFAHERPESEALLRELSEKFPPEYSRPTLSRRVAQTLAPDLQARVSEELVDAIARSPEEARLMRAIGTRSYITVPLRSRDQLLGVIAFGTTHRAYTSSDLTLAEELGRRAAVAVENARLYESERAARAVAERASRAKSEFLASMSHELRTPLTAIIGYGELLADGITGPVTDDQREQLARIRASAMHLLGLIDEVLTLSRVEAGKETVRREPVDVSKLVQDTVSIVWPLAQAKGLSLSVRQPGDALTLVSDTARVRQILLNLLSNAVKFTARGDVSLSVYAERDAVCFTVRDTGIGIDRAQQHLVFEAFWQADQTHTRSASGTGLGLAVSRRLARLLGGDIDLTSTPGEGSTFTLRLPST